MKKAWSWMLIISGAAGVVSLTASVEMGVWVLVFASIAWWTWLNSTMAVGLFIILAPILPMLKITQTLGSVTLLKDVIIFSLFLKWFAWPLATKQLPYRRNTLLIPIIALAAWVTIGVIQADSMVLGILRARDILLYPLLYLGILYMPYDDRVWKEWAKWFLGGLVIIALLVGYQWWIVPASTVLRFDPIKEVWIPRISSIMAHPSILGEYLVIGLSLVLAIGVVTKTWSRRLVWAGCSMGLLGLIFLTYTRAAWIGAVVVMGSVIGLWVLRRVKDQGLVVVHRYGKKLAGAGVLAIVLILLGLSQTSVLRYGQAMVDPTYGSNQERLEFMARLIAPMTSREAIVGRGLGDVLEQNLRQVNISSVEVAAGSARDIQLAKNATLVDNQYLKTLVELGLVGLLLMGWIYWKMLRQTLVVIFNTNQTISGRVVGYWGLGVMAAFVIQGFFIDIWEIFPTNAYFWLAAALVMVASTSNAERVASNG